MAAVNSGQTTLTRRQKNSRADSESVVDELKAGSKENENELRAITDELKKEAKDVKNKLQKREDTYQHWFTSPRFLFPLGIFFGLFLGFLLIKPVDIPDIPASLAVLLSEYDISLPEFPQIDLSMLETEWRRLTSNIPEIWKLNNDGREFQVGDEMAARGLTAMFPVVLIPGVVSTGLESWSTSPEYRTFFRQKMWGGFHMVQQVTFNKEKWMAALMLDPVTGLDPAGAKVRAAEGIDAASSFIQGYWIWSKIVENLAAVNYDTNNLYLAPYDWRLSYYNLEERDGYFSKLKTTIEGFKKRQGKKVVLTAHSMGSTVVLVCIPPIWSFLFLTYSLSICAYGFKSLVVTFLTQILRILERSFKWVESPLHGGGGSEWVENHIEAVISVAGTHLGVAKAMSAFLSGEMRDTVQMNPAAAYVLERFFSKKERQKLFRSWPGSASMWVKGGDAVWGNHTSAPDDAPNATHTHGELIAFREAQDANVGNMTAEQVGTWVLEHTPTAFQRMLATNYSNGIERDEAQLVRNGLDHTKWTNPLEVQLPYAPSMTYYCVYGHGKETERSYWYARGEYEQDDTGSLADAGDARCANASDCVTPRAPLDMPLLRRNWIDAEFTDEGVNPKIRNGVKMGEGDGTVSLLSLGAMCVEGWKRKRWNPAGIRVVTVELPHNPIPTMPRGGANTSDHVDILGSTALNEVVVKVATGAGGEVRGRLVSRIREYAGRVGWD